MNRTILIFVLYFLSSVQLVSSQNQKKVDSLLQELKNSPIDSSRTPILVNLWRAHINNDVDKAMTYADSLISLGQFLKIDAILGTGYQRKGIAYYYLNDFKSSTEYYKKTLALSIKQNKIPPIAAMQLNIAINYKVLGNIDSALIYNKKAKSNFELANDSAGVGATYKNLSDLRTNQGYYKMALENAIGAADIFEKVGDSLNMSDSNILIANNYLKIGDTALAIQYFTAAIEVYKIKNDKHFQVQSMNYLADIYLNKSTNYDKTQHLIDESIKMSKEIKSPFYLIQSYQNQGRLFMKRKKYKQADTFLKKALFISDSINDKFNIQTSSLGLSKVHLATKNVYNARKNANRALQISTETNSLSGKREAYKLLSEIAKLDGNNNMALNYFQLFKEKNDSIYNIENGQRLSELQIIHETEKKEAALVLQEEEIKTLNAQAKNDKLTKTLYAGGTAAGLALSGLLFFGFRQRMKKNKIAREKQEEIYKQEIAFKQKELTSQTLHLVQKNTFLQELKDNLEKLKNSPEKFKMEFRRIVMLLKKESATDKDWEVFKSYFSEVHDNFDNKLKNINDSITEKDLRLASFIKMNLSTKEIAALLNVLPESVLTSKYRLKKKLGIDKETDVYNFLMKI